MLFLAQRRKAKFKQPSRESMCVCKGSRISRVSALNPKMHRPGAPVSRFSVSARNKAHRRTSDTRVCLLRSCSSEHTGNMTFMNPSLRDDVTTRFCICRRGHQSSQTPSLNL